MSFQDLVIPELINLVASKCDLNALQNLSLVSKDIDEILDVEIKVQKIKETIPEFFHRYIDFKSEHILKSRNINIGNKYSFTGYIDFIRFNNFTNEDYKTNIVYGYDYVNRFFISILYKDMLTNEKKIVTFFQRYDSDKSYYVSCQNTFIWESLCATHRFTNSKYETLPEVYRILFTLINEGSALNSVDSDDKYHYKFIYN
jgi:hypothetical protein